MGLIPTIGMMIVALSLMILPILFTSCTRTVYVDSNTNEVIKMKKYDGINFINLIPIEANNNFPDVYVDTYTDVLYVFYSYRMSPIMKADGTCLTYQEFLER